MTGTFCAKHPKGRWRQKVPVTFFLDAYSLPRQTRFDEFTRKKVLGERRKWISRGKGGRHLLCEATEGPLAAKGACHLFPKAVNLFLPLALSVS